MDTIGIGVIGCGYFGREFANLANEVNGLRTVAVFGGRNAAKTAEETGSVFTDSLEALLEVEGVDAVIIASPNDSHKEPALMAAARKKHVFCEKPVALTPEDTSEMLDACLSQNVRFMAAHIMHLMPGIAKAKLLIEKGEIGTPILCHAERTGWDEPKPADNWKKNTERSGGHLFHHIHELDLLLSIMGPAEAVFTAGGRVAHRQGEQDDTLLLTLFFSDGRLGTMQYGSAFRSAEHFVKINGTEGFVLLDLKKSQITVENSAGVKAFNCHDSRAENEERVALYKGMDGSVIHGDPSLRPPMFLKTLMKRELEVFRDAIRHDVIPESLQSLFDGSAAYRSVATASAAMRSLTAKRVIPIKN